MPPSPARTSPKIREGDRVGLEVECCSFGLTPLLTSLIIRVVYFHHDFFLRVVENCLGHIDLTAG